MEAFVDQLGANVVEYLGGVIAELGQSCGQLAERALVFRQLHRTSWQRLEISVNVID